MRTQACKGKAQGGILEKWPRNYCRMFKVGVAWMEALLKRIAGDRFDASAWAAIRAEKHKILAKDLSE
eukprot:8361864-Alexandrium_andersonii.AAC.1